MAPKKDKAKTGADKAEASKAATTDTAVTGIGVASSHLGSAVVAAATTQDDATAPPSGREVTPEGITKDVPQD
jgi:hypothetical protein